MKWRTVGATLALLAAHGAGGVAAQDFFNQDWLLNTGASRIYMGTVKANAVFETHHFSSVDGAIGRDGEASVKIELASADTGIDLRDVRMRFLLFETFKFPHAEVRAKLDKNRLRDLAAKTRVAYPLKFTLKLHGVEKEIDAPVWVTRISEKQVTVATIQPIVVTAEDFGLTPNVQKLVDAIGGTLIAPAASITFDLLFGAGELRAELEEARTAAARRSAAAAAAPIDLEACETRFKVISTTGAIHFKSASAELDSESEPLIASVADIASRCPAVRIEVSGHTDSDGGRDFNQQLSEQRARAVANELVRRGVAAARIQSNGYGASRPVAQNDSGANKAKNRRIEFVVRKS